MLRALVVEYQDDPNVWNLGDQWLFGDSILVAPIFDEGARRRVYLPAGAWTDWWTKDRIPGGRWIETAADIERIPLFVREGGIIALGPVMNYVDEKRIDTIKLLVARFESDGVARTRVAVNDELVDVSYTARGGKHLVKIGKSDAAFDVEVLGGGEIKIQRT